jgi:trigger factor
MYLQYTGMTVDRLRDQMKDQAVKNIHSRLVLEAVVAAEKLEATDEEYNNELQKMADQYKMELDKVKELMGEPQLKSMKEDLAVQKAAKFLVDNAKETAKKASKSTDDAEEKPKRTRKTVKKADEEAVAEEKPKRTRKTAKKDEE